MHSSCMLYTSSITYLFIYLSYIILTLYHTILCHVYVAGSITDIGLVIGRLLRGDMKETWKLKVLVPIYLGIHLLTYTIVCAYILINSYTLI